MVLPVHTGVLLDGEGVAGVVLTATTVVSVYEQATDPGTVSTSV